MRSTRSGSPVRSSLAERRWGTLLLGLGTLLLVRYLPALAGLLRGVPENPAYRENPTSFLLIAFMDLGIALPGSVAAGIALRRGRAWARKALYLILGWFALVGCAVAAMAVVMRVKGDPPMSTGEMAAFLALALGLGSLAGELYRPVVSGRPGRPGSEPIGGEP